MSQDILHLLDVGSELFDVLRSFENILAVEMTELDLGNIIRLDFINSEADHQVRNDLALLLGRANYLDRFVDIKKDFLQAFEQVKLILRLAQIKINPALNALGSECYPLVEYLADSHDPRRTRNQHIEVAGEGVLKRSDLIKLLHELVGVCALFEVDCDFKSRLVRFVTDIAYLTERTRLKFFNNLVDYRFGSRCRRDLGYVDTFIVLVVAVFRPDLEAAASCLINRINNISVIEKQSAAGKIGSLKRFGNIGFGVFNQRNRSFAKLTKIKRTN